MHRNDVRSLLSKRERERQTEREREGERERARERGRESPKQERRQREGLVNGEVWLSLFRGSSQPKGHGTRPCAGKLSWHHMLRTASYATPLGVLCGTSNPKYSALMKVKQPAKDLRRPAEPKNPEASYLWLVGNGGMGYNYNYYYYHPSIPY